RFLASHSVGNKQDLMRVSRGLHPFQFTHQLFIDLQTAGSVDDGDVAPFTSSCLHSCFGNIHWIPGRAVSRGWVHWYPHFLGYNAQLIDCRRSIGIGWNEIRRAAEFEPEIASKLAGSGGFA